MRRMLSVALITAGSVLILAVVLFGRSRAGSIAAPPITLPSPADRAAAPAFSARTLHGTSVSLDGYRGRPLVINFFAAWCAPCRAEAPQFVALDRRYGGRVGLLSVAVQTDHRSKLDDFIRRHSMTWPVVWDRSGRLVNSFDILGQPITYIIDAQGRVVFRIVGQTTEQRVGGVLDKLLA